MNKIKEALNKDIKEYNVKLLVLSGIIFIAIMGLISYKITMNSSYALFTNDITSSKVLTIHYEDDATTSDVYIYSESSIMMGTPLDADTYTGYCVVNATNEYNSCTDDNLGFMTMEACNLYLAAEEDEVSTCSQGSWTISTSTTYTNNYSSLNKDYFIKHSINSSSTVLESSVCYILDNTPYCLKGYDINAYQDNIETLQDSFGIENCTDHNTYYSCTSGTITTEVYPDGNVRAYHDVNDKCSINNFGVSYCETLSQPTT